MNQIKFKELSLWQAAFQQVIIDCLALLWILILGGILAYKKYIGHFQKACQQWHHSWGSLRDLPATCSRTHCIGYLDTIVAHNSLYVFHPSWSQWNHFVLPSYICARQPFIRGRRLYALYTLLLDEYLVRFAAPRCRTGAWSRAPESPCTMDQRSAPSSAIRPVRYLVEQGFFLCYTPALVVYIIHFQEDPSFF